ncbi:nucleotide exchange factor SIL1 isoform X2 [Macrosteles quadrilineatus]|uniref:nucleotide exchange factor SIL1 isoform X2 n=1 Tax=Macrosteles quadrilineatus TaxID=74068 RepID=UPI0023E248B7|nr:nucleotide exchange factor SIL1 isoform X2 [Macrosteles quadrilineatus]
MGAQVKEISKLICALLALQLVGLSLNAGVLNENSVSKRKFTNEWQEIGEDEAIPPGLHIRINLSTGKKEAKLLDNEDTKEEKTSIAVVEENVETNTVGLDELKLEERLKDIPSEATPTTPEEIQKVKKTFRPYDELKKDFEKLKMSVKTDLEVMDELFVKYQKIMEKRKEQTMEELGNLNILSPLEESHLAILTDLEYMVHQVDNAKEFILSGGLPMIVYPSLNSSSSVIRSESARLLGAAVQNNAVCQIKALESGALDTLLRVLALDSAASVRSTAVYALSCLIRRFPLAQSQFVDLGGLAVLASLFDGDSGEQLKLQVKVVTFIDDLLVERHDAKLSQLEAITEDEPPEEKTQAKERLRQYQLVNLETLLKEQQWCQHLVKLFKRELQGKSTSLSDNTVAAPDLDVVEKVTKVDGVSHTRSWSYVTLVMFVGASI